MDQEKEDPTKLLRPETEEFFCASADGACPEQLPYSEEMLERRREFKKLIGRKHARNQPQPDQMEMNDRDSMARLKSHPRINSPGPDSSGKGSP